MSDRQSKRRGRGQFLPRVLCLEDRTVPATFFVDPNFGTPAAGTPVTFNTAYPGEQAPAIYAGTLAAFQANNARTAFTNFDEALKAANFNPGLDTIRVAGDEVPIPVQNATTPDDPVAGNALQVTDDLIIQGTGQGATILAPTGDTTFGGVPDEFTAIFRVEGADLTVTDLTLDAAGKQVGFGFAIRDGADDATATFDRVTVRNVQFDLGTTIDGIAIAGFDDTVADTNEVVLNVQNSTIENSGLHGISYENADGQVFGVTIAGRGADEHTNAQNGVQIVGASNVLITGSTITGNVDGNGITGSSGVLVGRTADGAPAVNLLGNTLTGNTIGLTVGTVAGDNSAVTARFNNIFDNLQGVDANQNSLGVDARNSFWDSATGPFNLTTNPDGTGNSVTNNVLFEPFLTSPTPVIPAANEAAYLAAIRTVGVAVTPTQPEPVLAGPVLFQVVFADAVTGFDASDVTVVSSPAGSTPVVNVSGSGTTYTVSVSGLLGQGEVAIQIPAGAATTADGRQNFQSGVASVDFGAAPNTAPQITPIANQTTQVGTATPAASFTVTDTETPEAALIVTATSSNQAVVPNGAIVLGGAGANRTVSVTPIAAGTATITVTVQDGSGATSSTSFNVTSNPLPPANTPPTLSALTNQSATVNTPSGAQTITVGDAQSPADQLTVTATSSNPAVVPNANITVSGTGANRTISFTPVAEGTATITVTVTDPGGQSTTGTFVATGTPEPEEPDSTVLLGTEEYAAGPGITGGPIVRYFNPDGSERLSATVFADGFTGGVRVAVGDFNLDGTPDIVVGSGPGAVTAVRVLDGINPSIELFRIIPFEETFTGGVFVAAGDLNGDGRADLVITPDEGGGARARVFVASKNLATGGVDFNLAADFIAIEDPAFRGGARAAIGDVNGDGAGDLIVSAGFGGGPRIAGFDGKSVSIGNTTEKLFADFFAFEPSVQNGAFVTVGDINGDGFADIIAGAGPGGGPRVFAVSGKDILTNTQVQVANFFAGNIDNRGGIRVAAKNLDGDDQADLVVGDGTGAGSRLTAYAGSTIPADGTPPVLYDFDAFPGFTNGIFVG